MSSLQKKQAIEIRGSR